MQRPRGKLVDNAAISSVPYAVYQIRCASRTCLICDLSFREGMFWPLRPFSLFSSHFTLLRMNTGTHAPYVLCLNGQMSSVRFGLDFTSKDIMPTPLKPIHVEPSADYHQLQRRRFTWPPNQLYARDSRRKAPMCLGRRQSSVVRTRGPACTGLQRGRVSRQLLGFCAHNLRIAR